jgi:hypothetical protein
LEEKFAKVDTSIVVVEEFKKAKKKSERLHPESKKMIREPESVEKLRPLFAARAKCVPTVIFDHNCFRYQS